MNKTIGYVTLFVFGAMCVAISVAKPELLNDKNKFLSNFVNHEFINVLGIILAITLASAAQIHLAFNHIEEQHKTRGSLKKSRANLRKATSWLLGLFIFGLTLVVVKPIATDVTTPIAEGIFNSLALVVLLWQVLILMVLTQLVFMIEPEFPPAPTANPSPKSQQGTQEKIQP